MTPSADARSALQQLLRTLLAEEEHLVALVQLAGREQEALIESDLDRLESISDQMQHVANEMDALERERERLVESLDQPGATLQEVAALADDLDIHGLDAARDRLLLRVGELQEAQEQNARLILAAANLRQRWVGLLTTMAAPTYSPGGAQQAGQTRRIVSRSA